MIHRSFLRHSQKMRGPLRLHIKGKKNTVLLSDEPTRCTFPMNCLYPTCRFTLIPDGWSATEKEPGAPTITRLANSCRSAGPQDSGGARGEGSPSFNFLSPHNSNRDVPPPRRFS